MRSIICCRFRKGIEALNAVGPERMPLVLSRVIASIHASGTYAFTEKEEAQLREVLAVDADVVRLSLETAAYIFERAALFSLKAPQLLALLGDTGLEEAHVSLFAWRPLLAGVHRSLTLAASLCAPATPC